MNDWIAQRNSKKNKKGPRGIFIDEISKVEGIITNLKKHVIIMLKITLNTSKRL